MLREIESITRGVTGDPSLRIAEDQLLEDIVAWDSLVQTRTLVAIENRFQILFDLDELASVSTITALLDTMERKIPRP